MNPAFQHALPVFSIGDRDAQRKFILNCPPCINTPIALQFLDFGQPNSGLAALDALCNGYNGQQAQLELAITLATALSDIGAHRYRQNAPMKDEALIYATNGVYFQAKFLFDFGQFEAAIKAADTAIPFLQGKERLQFERLCAAQLYKTDALLMLEQFEAARQHFNTIQGLPFIAGPKVQHDSLERKINNSLGSATALPSPDKIRDEYLESQQSNLDALNALSEIMRGGNSDAPPDNMMQALEALQQKLTQLQQPEAALNNASIYQENAEATEQAHALFSNFFGANPLHEAQLQFSRIGTVFSDPNRAQDPDALRKALSEYEALCAFVAEHKLVYDLHSVWWAMGICHNRLGQYREGLELVERIWVDIERQRTQIRNYTERAGLLNKFEFLFTRLCDFNYKLGDAQGMLRSIESSKGRVLADALDRQTPQNALPAAESHQHIVQSIQALMQLHAANYLTFLLEDEYSYAVLVSSKGKLFSRQIPLGRLQLQSWLDKQLHNPQKWRARSGGLFGAQNNVDISTALSPFVDWLLPLLVQGELTEGAHLCYCPDEILSFFPLHYVKIQDKYLLEYFSLSRTQSAYTLLQNLNRPKLFPLEFYGVVATAQEDQADVEKMQGFRVSVDFLKTLRPGSIAASANSDWNQLCRIPLDGKIVHFTTHGTFPLQAHENPYERSGLLLYEGPTAPSLNQISGGHLLSPERVLRQKSQVQNAHITLQACVSGRSKEGIGGDALGLEWAFLLSGASSILASNWDVDYRYAAHFCNKFYENWLLKGQTRAKAFQAAALEIMQEPLPDQHPAAYFWAGFSLMGDWR